MKYWYLFHPPNHIFDILISHPYLMLVNSHCSIRYSTFLPKDTNMIACSLGFPPTGKCFRYLSSLELSLFSSCILSLGDFPKDLNTTYLLGTSNLISLTPKCWHALCSAIEMLFCSTYIHSLCFHSVL